MEIEGSQAPEGDLEAQLAGSCCMQHHSAGWYNLQDPRIWYDGSAVQIDVTGNDHWAGVANASAVNVGMKWAIGSNEALRGCVGSTAITVLCSAVDLWDYLCEAV